MCLRGKVCLNCLGQILVSVSHLRSPVTMGPSLQGQVLGEELYSA